MIAVRTPYAHYVRALGASWSRREHAAATFCAHKKRHGRYKDDVETSCEHCRDAVGTLCTRY